MCLSVCPVYLHACSMHVVRGSHKDGVATHKVPDDVKEKALGRTTYSLAELPNPDEVSDSTNNFCTLEVVVLVCVHEVLNVQMNVLVVFLCVTVFMCQQILFSKDTCAYVCVCTCVCVCLCACLCVCSCILQIIPIPLNPGDALVFHGALKHFTPPNVSTSPWVFKGINIYTSCDSHSTCTH